MQMYQHVSPTGKSIKFRVVNLSVWSHLALRFTSIAILLLCVYNEPATIQSTHSIKVLSMVFPLKGVTGYGPK